MTSSRVWDHLLDPLSRLGALAVELRGAGGSTPGPSVAADLELLADDVRAAADHAGIERFHLVGHSMGGQLAQLVAAKWPARVRSLALLNPVPVDGLPLPAEVAAAFRAAGGQRAAFDGIFSAACRELTAVDRAALLDEAMAIAPEIIAAHFDAWSRGLAGALLDSIAAPTLVLATDDPFLPPALLADAVVARIRGARLARLPGPGHYPQVERPAATADLLHAFWEGA